MQIEADINTKTNTKQVQIQIQIHIHIYTNTNTAASGTNFRPTASNHDQDSEDDKCIVKIQLRKTDI